MSDVDSIVFDEGQILTDRAMDNMLASMNTASNPLAFFMGTPPRPEDASEVWMRMRQECLDGEVTDAVWIECGAEEDCDPGDRRQWSIANPSFPHRTPVTAMKRLQRKLQPDSWLREGLGVYRKQDLAIFDLRKWTTQAKYDAAQPERVILTVAVSPDRSWSSIGVAGECGDKTLVMCYSARGMNWVASKVEELQKVRRIDRVAIIGGQAKSIRTDLAKAGVEYDVISQVDEGAACGAFLQAHKDATVVHLGQPELDVAVANARTRRTASGEIEIWDAAKTSIDISPLRACAAAFYLWGLNTPIGIY
jgi:phage terminase large subunit-like protein